MRVLQVPFTFAPDPMGGTEVYVASLSKELLARGVEAVIAAPGAANSAYVREGLTVHRYAVGQPTLTQLYGEGDPQAAANFDTILEQTRPDIVHFHAHTSAVSLTAARCVKSRGLPLVLTYHTPTVSCTHGTMMRFGESPCDGLLDRGRCAACTLHANGLAKGVAEVVGALPSAVGVAVARAGRAGGAWTALQMSHLIESRHQTTRAFLEAADRIVAVCDWIQEVLTINGVAPEKVTLSRQGLPYPVAEINTSTVHSDIEDFDSNSHNATRFVFLGRLDRVKGIETAIAAMRKLPTHTPVTLDIYGITQSGSEAYRQVLITLAAGDARIRFYEPVPAERVVNLLHQYDALVVPSRWLETGPLVVLEAFAAGIPVIGSDLGGIAELVVNGVNGLLVPAGDSTAWAEALTRFAAEPTLRASLRGGIHSPRTTVDVTDDMITLYQELALNE